jgi:hypothetical protein
MLLKSWAIPPRETADGLELLGLAESFFEHVPLGDIVDHEEDLGHGPHAVATDATG